jgi:hypothetical protein
MILEALIIPIGGRILSFLWSCVSMLLDAVILHIDMTGYYWQDIILPLDQKSRERERIRRVHRREEGRGKENKGKRKGKEK